MPVGYTLTWTNTSDEGHQVTFFAPNVPQPTGSARGWAATAKPGSTVTFDGSIFVHTGVLAKNEKITVLFTKTGTYLYLCPIHPGMDGTVRVVGVGEPYTTDDKAWAYGKLESEVVLALEAPTRKAALSRATKTQQADGATLWKVVVGPKVPAPTGYLEIKENFPKDLKIKKGDTVQWVFESTHSVTFLSGGALPAGSAAAIPAAKPSPEYDGKSFYHSALPTVVEGRPLPVFELKFPNTGTFPYTCVLHGTSLGHVGTVTVEP